MLSVIGTLSRSPLAPDLRRTFLAGDVTPQVLHWTEPWRHAHALLLTANGKGEHCYYIS